MRRTPGKYSALWPPSLWFRRAWLNTVCAPGPRCSPPGSVLSRAHIYGYGRSLRPPQGTSIAPRRRAVFRQALLGDGATERTFFEQPAALAASNALDLEGNALPLMQRVARHFRVPVWCPERDWFSHLIHGSSALGTYDALKGEEVVTRRRRAHQLRRSLATPTERTSGLCPDVRLIPGGKAGASSWFVKRVLRRTG